MTTFRVVDPDPQFQLDTVVREAYNDCGGCQRPAQDARFAQGNLFHELQGALEVAFVADLHRNRDADVAVRMRMVEDGRRDQRLIGDDRLDAVQLTDGSSIPRAALFIRPALHARDDSLITSLGFEVDESGLAKVDATGRTTVSGVWAAGNASNPRAQVITAAGEGSAAAIDINNDLVEEDVREARQSLTTSARAATPSTNRLQRTHQ